jgi:hypothetical protein
MQWLEQFVIQMKCQIFQVGTGMRGGLCFACPWTASYSRYRIDTLLLIIWSLDTTIMFYLNLEFLEIGN